MKQKGTIFCLLWLLFTATSAQPKDVREEVFVHLNSSFLLTGETLLFSSFVKGKTTGEASPLSQILYVELVGEDNQPVFQQKIKLDSGRGHGNYFISSLVPTGNYQLLAYTRWMRNFNDYFQTKIAIVNPFEAYETPDREETSQLISFFPEGGKIVPGTDNLMVYQHDQPEKYVKAKIVSESGETAATFDPARSMGRFSISAKAGKTYQLILEDHQGNFVFQSLPELQSGQVIQVRDTKGAYLIKLAGSPENGKQLTISNLDGPVLTAEPEQDRPVRLSKQGLKEGFYQVSFGQAKRVFYHGEISESVQSGNPKGVATRSLVELPIETDFSAEVSVSVRKVEELDGTPRSSEGTFFNGLTAFSRNLPATTTWVDLDNLLLIHGIRDGYFDNAKYVGYLPDLRGQIVSGSIQSSESDITNQTIIYAISGEPYQLAASETNGDGRFALQLDPFIGNREAYLTVYNDESAYSFELDNDFMDSYPEFDAPPLQLDSGIVKRLVDRSVRNQIENAYYEPEQDSAINTVDWVSQFPDFSHFYYLDDYNRFPDLYESFIEYIPVVAARKKGDRLKVFPNQSIPGMGEPLVLIDGVPTSAKRILSFSPYKIESIGVLNNRYFLGALTADGIISFQTYEKDLMGFRPGSNTTKVDYQGVEQAQVYNFPDYGNSGLERIPDYREQLFWDPQVRLSAENPYILSFYTSDSPGIYEINIQGFDKNGAPVEIKKNILVQKPNQQASN